MTQITGRLASIALVCLILSGLCFADPSITALSPTTGVVGQAVTITGSGFGSVQGTSTVSLSGTSATVAIWSDAAIVAIVPSGAQSGTFTATIGGQNATSPSFTVIPIPIGWSDGDIGTVGLSGSASYANGVYTVKGAGVSIGSTADGLNFAYQSLTGDGTIIARVASLQGGTYPQVGVMIRETLGAGSTEAFVSYSSNYARFLTRASTGASSTTQTNSSFTSPTYPYWTKLVRSGNSFSGYVSNDGMNWVAVGSSITITMASTVYFGLAVSSDSTTTLETATFDNVSTGQSSAPAPAITAVSATTGSIGGQVTITGNNFGAAQGGSQVTLNGAPMTIVSWSNTSIVFAISAGATSGPLLVVVEPSMDDSNQIVFTVTNQPLPSTWLDGDIGSVGLAGGATYASEVFTLKGAGSSIGGTADGLHFVYQSLTGDGSITARVATLQGASFPRLE